MNLPNILTVFRIALIPFYILFFDQATTQSSYVAAFIFFVASMTDVLDGYLARSRSEVTKFGKFLDPIADKLLILSALFLLVANHRVSAWLAIVIVGREFAVTGFRAIASSEGIVISAESTGKIKMMFQAISIFILTIDFPHPVFHQAGSLILIVSMGLAIFSAGQYFSKYGRRIGFFEAK
jgi:CDP-diacylglycerol---glycerol-3-phosphate 3-phosphatidyltransferase